MAAMTFFLQLIAQNPEHLQACQEEIDLLFASKCGTDNKHLSLDDLAQLKFLERCIMESSRIAPAAPHSSDNCLRACKLTTLNSRKELFSSFPRGLSIEIPDIIQTLRNLTQTCGFPKMLVNDLPAPS